MCIYSRYKHILLLLNQFHLLWLFYFFLCFIYRLWCVKYHVFAYSLLQFKYFFIFNGFCFVEFLKRKQSGEISNFIFDWRCIFVQIVQRQHL